MTHPWLVRAETEADAAAVRTVDLAAFPTAEEADLVEALRADPGAWFGDLALVAEDGRGSVVGHTVLTRCHIGAAPALALAPVAVLPGHQDQGVGAALVRAALAAAGRRGEHHVVVLGHPSYYPRFGFSRASLYGIRVGFDVPDEALMALTLDPEHPLPAGTVRYAAAFGV